MHLRTAKKNQNLFPTVLILIPTGDVHRTLIPLYNSLQLLGRSILRFQLGLGMHFWGNPIGPSWLPQLGLQCQADGLAHPRAPQRHIPGCGWLLSHPWPTEGIPSAPPSSHCQTSPMLLPPVLGEPPVSSAPGAPCSSSTTGHGLGCISTSSFLTFS